MRKLAHVTDELLSTADAAELLGVNVATLNRWANIGTITPAAQGTGTAARYYHRSDIDRLAGDTMTHDEGIA